jgi:hypothetical protein
VAKKTRIFQKLFAESADTADVGQFGSLYDASPVTSKDPTIIQALSHWVKGWKEAVIAVRRPAMQDFNGVLLVAFYQICYLLEIGIAEYDASTTYYTNAFCQVSGVVYKSLVDANIGNAPASNPTKWELALQQPVGFGSWVDKSASYGNQQAATDGFVVVMAATSGGGDVEVLGYTDSSATPTTCICGGESRDTGWGHPGRAGFTMPVKKGDYWRVEVTYQAGGSISVRWMPSGS